MNVMIEMQEITKTFPGVNAIEHVSLKVEAGAVHAICGENGAGKSTLNSLYENDQYPSLSIYILH